MLKNLKMEAIYKLEELLKTSQVQCKNKLILELINDYITLYDYAQDVISKYDYYDQIELNESIRRMAEYLIEEEFYNES